MALKYTTDNVLISCQLALAAMLRAHGYDIRWHATGAIDTTTWGAAPKGIITLVPEYPRDPAFLVRPSGLNDGSIPTEGEITIPVLRLTLPNAPIKVRREGLGMSTFERQRGLMIDGFVYDEFQQRELHDLLYDWLEEGDPRITVSDYTDPTAPVALDPVDVLRAEVSKGENPDDIEAIRYYLSAVAVISYFE